MGRGAKAGGGGGFGGGRHRQTRHDEEERTFANAAAEAERAAAALDAIFETDTAAANGDNKSGGKTDAEEYQALQAAYAKVHGGMANDGDGPPVDANKALMGVGEGSDENDDNGDEYENYGVQELTTERDIRGNPVVRGVLSRPSASTTTTPSSSAGGGGGGAKGRGKGGGGKNATARGPGPKLAGKAEDQRYAALRSMRRDACEKRRSSNESDGRSGNSGGGGGGGGGGGSRRSSNEREMAGPGGKWYVEKGDGGGSPTTRAAAASSASSGGGAGGGGGQEKFVKPRHEREALVSNFLGKGGGGVGGGDAQGGAADGGSGGGGVEAAATGTAAKEAARQKKPQRQSKKAGAASSSSESMKQKKRSSKKPPAPPKKLDRFGFILDDDGGVGEESGRGGNRMPPGEEPTEGTALSSSTIGKKGEKAKKKKKKRRKKKKKKGDKSGGGGWLSAKRERKWTSMMDTWESKPPRRKSRRERKVKRRARKGVPDTLRGAAWARMGDVPNKIDFEKKGEYDRLVRLSSGAEGGSNHYENEDEGAMEASVVLGGADADDAPEYYDPTSPKATMDTIERDLERTFPKHYMFYDSGSSSSDSDSSSSEDESSTSEEDSGENNTIDGDNNDASSDSVDEPSQDAGAAAAAHCNVPASWGAIEEESAGYEENYSENGKGGPPAAAASSSSSYAAAGKSSVSRVLDVVNGGCGVADLGDVDSVLSDGQTSSVGLNPARRPSTPSPVTAGGGAPASAGTGGAAGEGGAAGGGGTTKHLSKEERRIARREAERKDYVAAEGGIAALRRVLRAYSTYDPDVGYCQGMNFVAAMFLTFMSEEEAFWLLVHVMNEEPCRMRGLYGEGMADAHRVLHVAEGLVVQFLPKLAAHLERENVHITMYATQWLLTLYASSFPFDLVTRVWDCFLAEGWKIVFRVMLAILDRASPDLMAMRFEEILGYFRELPSKIDGDATLDASLKIPLKRKHIARLEDEWKAKQQR